MALAPRNAEVLNSFGEFLEQSRQDLLQADHFFARAIGRIIDIRRG
jgi:Tfp pilus assembly protein PilF